MDNWWDNSTYGMSVQQKRQREREEAYEESLVDDLGEEFRLPINHQPTENLDIDNLEQASVDTKLTSSNIGFRLLQKMGWKGKGLGKEEQGIVEPIKAGVRDPKLGVGKQEQDDYFTSEENIQRKKLDVELEETEELAKKRELKSAGRYRQYIRMSFQGNIHYGGSLANLLRFLLPWWLLLPASCT